MIVRLKFILFINNYRNKAYLFIKYNQCKKIKLQEFFKNVV